MMTMKFNKFYAKEIGKLACGLTERGITFRLERAFDGLKIDVPSQDWDAICHSGSYGGSQALLEIMGRKLVRNTYDTVEGWLTADEILERLDENKEP